jgi:hypothetical protein
VIEDTILPDPIATGPDRNPHRLGGTGSVAFKTLKRGQERAALELIDAKS